MCLKTPLDYDLENQHSDNLIAKMVQNILSPRRDSKQNVVTRNTFVPRLSLTFLTASMK